MSIRTAVAVVALLVGADLSYAQAPRSNRQADRAAQGTTDRARARGDGAARRAQDRARRLENAARERRAARQGTGVTESFSRTVTLGSDGSFDLANIAGRVSVTGVGGGEVRIEATKRVWHERNEEARALLKSLNVVVSEGAGRVGVRTEYPRQRSYDAEVEYTVSVPQGASVTLRVSSGDITVSNLRGELRAESVGGSVTATSVGDVRLARSVSGDVTVDGAEGTELMASTLSGAVNVRRAKSRTIDLRSVGGALRLSDSESGRVSMQTISGAVEYAGRIGRGGRYDLLSRSGRIVVAPTGDDGFEVEATTMGGELRSDFPLTVHQITQRGGRAGRPSARMQGTVGAGGGLLTLQSLNGGIAIVRR